MSNNISYRHTVAQGLRLPANFDDTVEYDHTNPKKDHGKAVTQIASGAYGPTYALAGAADAVHGSIFIVEPPDAATTKGTIHIATGGSVVWLRYTGTAPAIGDAVVGAAGTGGDTGDGFVAVDNTNGTGRVVEVDTTRKEVGVIFS